MLDAHKKLTFKVDLPGGQDRLRQAVLYVALKSASATRFGMIKLNKIIWKADFDSFYARRQPVTGRPYKRQQFGPVAAEMLPLYSEMLRNQMIEVSRVDFGDGIVEKRTIPLVAPDNSKFSPDDLSFLDSSIQYYLSKCPTRNGCPDIRVLPECG